MVLNMPKERHIIIRKIALSTDSLEKKQRNQREIFILTNLQKDLPQ